MATGATHPQTDTIFAIATPGGMGGVGVIRVSGPRAAEIAGHLADRPLQPRRVHLRKFLDENGRTIDTGLALLFPGPASFTGEDVFEVHGHGSPVAQQMLSGRIMQLGARPARPGEFLERAFLNDKLDLVQAEAIADLIESGTEAAARAAQRSLEGVFSTRVGELQEQLTALRAWVEAALDFPEEEEDYLDDSDIGERLHNLRGATAALLDEAHQGRLLRDGITIAIIGPPNAGKSSLLNAMAGREAAIVTEVPGTTRDVLRESISVDGMPVHFADTAGIRESADRIEAEGVRRARDTLASSDLVLLVIDITAPQEPQLALLDEIPDGTACIRVYNKIDIAGRKGGSDGNGRRVFLSAKTGQGLDLLSAMIRDVAGLASTGEGSFSARTRHLDILRRVQAHLGQGYAQWTQSAAAETLAEELRLAQRALGEITGEFLPDDLLGAIFSSFCIGK